MGDYLGNLIGKATNQTPVLQPRQASWFAPSPYRDGALAQASFGAVGPAGLSVPTSAPDTETLLPWPGEGSEEDQSLPVPLAVPPAALSLETTSPSPAEVWPAPVDTSEPAAIEATPPLSSATQPPVTIQRNPAAAPIHPRQPLLAADQTETQAPSPHQPGLPPATAEVSKPALILRVQPGPEQSPPRMDADEAVAPVSHQPSRHLPQVQGRQSGPPQWVAEAGRSQPQLSQDDRRLQAQNEARLATLRIVAPLLRGDEPDNAVDHLLQPEPYTTELRTRVASERRNPERVSAQSAGHEQSAERSSPVAALAPLRALPNTGAVHLSSSAAQPATGQSPYVRALTSRSPATPKEGANVLTPPAIRASVRVDARTHEPPAPPEPTIQVTIGRIEVRATPPPAAPVRKQSTPAVMNLNDYLQARNGGSR